VSFSFPPPPFRGKGGLTKAWFSFQASPFSSLSWFYDYLTSFFFPEDPGTQKNTFSLCFPFSIPFSPQNCSSWAQVLFFLGGWFRLFARRGGGRDDRRLHSLGAGCGFKTSLPFSFFLSTFYRGRKGNQSVFSVPLPPQSVSLQGRSLFFPRLGPAKNPSPSFPSFPFPHKTTWAEPVRFFFSGGTKTFFCTFAKAGGGGFPLFFCRVSFSFFFFLGVGE